MVFMAVARTTVVAMVVATTAARMAIVVALLCTAIAAQDRCIVARGLGPWAQVPRTVSTEAGQRWAAEAGEPLRRPAEEPGDILRLRMQPLPMDIGTRSEMVTQLLGILDTPSLLLLDLLMASAAVSSGSELASVSGSASVSVSGGPAGVLSGAGPPILIHHTRGGDSTRRPTTFTRIPTTRRFVGSGVLKNESASVVSCVSPRSILNI